MECAEPHGVRRLARNRPLKKKKLGWFYGQSEFLRRISRVGTPVAKPNLAFQVPLRSRGARTIAYHEDKHGRYSWPKRNLTC